MIPGLHGPLLSHDFAEKALPAAFHSQLGESERPSAARLYRLWWQQASRTLGPASSVRALFDRGAAPLMTLLGFRASGVRLLTSDGPGVARLGSAGGEAAGLIVVSWGLDLDRVWTDAVGEGIRLDARWCFCFNGARLRIVDAERTYARRFLEVDLEAAADHQGLFAVLWGLLRAGAVARGADAGATGVGSAFPPSLRFGEARRSVERGGGRRTDAPGVLDRAIDASDKHAAGVRQSLQAGVDTALLHLVHLIASLAPDRSVRPRGPGPAVASGAVFEQSLTIVYRILFLLFAEARGLVPVWHPVYREGYSVTALQAHAEASRQPRGLWETLEAITRLAHAGCEAGDLRVTPFNGRLFAPGHTPLADRPRAGGRRRWAQGRDTALGRVLLALTTRPAGAGGRERISYGDLGVEQLGAVYERVLDYEPTVEGQLTASAKATAVRRSFTRRRKPTPTNGFPEGRLKPGGATGVGSAFRRTEAPAISLRRTGRRKATGTFYTPRSLTDFLVRRTLHPLVDDAPPDAILALRVLDPAMGSGAFLVAACRYLATAYERALVRAGAYAADDVTDADRAGFRRLVAQRCLYGVDVNPMAVQLGRLSLWLATLAADKPLTFLDHHLRAGDSLAGASLTDLTRRPPPRCARRERSVAALPLFDTTGLTAALGDTWRPRARLATEPDDTLDAVRGKERLLDRLTGPAAPLARWRAVADLWCAAWFWPDRSQSPSAGEFWALVDHLVGSRSALAAHVLEPRLQTARQLAREQAFFHWTLEFPEAFFDEVGQPLARPGFDAVIGNPPWEMLRADQGASSGRAPARHPITRRVRFARDSGIYALQGAGHPNLYQLFLERALTLVRRGGRVGLVLPGGLLSDQGSAALRRHLLTRCDTDAVVSFDNRDGIFPIHRSYKFLLLTATTDRPTASVRCRFSERSPAMLDAVPDGIGDQAADAFPIVLSLDLVRRLSGDALAIPELRSRLDVAIAEKAAALAPPLGHPDGWAVRFGRELNATDDRPHFLPPGRGLPVVEGKAIRPFRVSIGEARFSIAAATARRLLDRAATFGRPRLAYRDVASATNRLTLIAAIVPAGVVTTHTVFCLRSDLDLEAQHCLCGLLNSYVANYLARQRVSTHVTVAMLERLPVPHPARGSAAFVEIAERSARLAAERAGHADEARLQARVAALYGLTRDEFAHVLGTFPLVEAERRQAALDAFDALARAG